MTMKFAHTAFIGLVTAAIVGCAETPTGAPGHCYLVDDVLEVFSSASVVENSNNEAQLNRHLWLEWLGDEAATANRSHDGARVCEISGYRMVTFGDDSYNYVLFRSSKPLVMRTSKGHYVFASALGEEFASQLVPGGNNGAIVTLWLNAKSDLMLEYSDPESEASFLDVGFNGVALSSHRSEKGMERRVRVENRLCPVFLGCAICPDSADGQVTSIDAVPDQSGFLGCRTLDRLMDMQADRRASQSDSSPN